MSYFYEEKMQLIWELFKLPICGFLYLKEGIFKAQDTSQLLPFLHKEIYNLQADMTLTFYT